MSNDKETSLFGVNSDYEGSSIHIIPVPWEGTVSYGVGTSLAPRAILEASTQIDTYDEELGFAIASGVFLHPFSALVENINKEAMALRDKIRKEKNENTLNTLISRANELGRTLNQFVETSTKTLQDEGKIVGILGGEHSVPLGAYKSSSRDKEFTLLQFDAHADLRESYEGFNYSHASIMYNALNTVPNIKKLVQIGIRDFSEEEFLFTTAQNEGIFTLYDSKISDEKIKGVPFDEIIEEAINNISENVWISLDIDGLDPSLCPSTGTPVPGGLSFNEITYIIKKIAKSDRKIIGFDLCEIAPDKNTPLNENIGMRLLYKLCAWTLKSNNL